MSKHEVEVTIDEASGEVLFHIQGIKGGGCVKVLDDFAKMVGRAGKLTPTPEMSEVAAHKIKAR